MLLSFLDSDSFVGVDGEHGRDQFEGGVLDCVPVRRGEFVESFGNLKDVS